MLARACLKEVSRLECQTKRAGQGYKDRVASPLSARDQEDPFSRHQSAVKEMVQEGHSDDEIVAALTQ
jgi:hypothetical protein